MMENSKAVQEEPTASRPLVEGLSPSLAGELQAQLRPFADEEDTPPFDVDAYWASATRNGRAAVRAYQRHLASMNDPKQEKRDHDFALELERQLGYGSVR